MHISFTLFSDELQCWGVVVQSLIYLHIVIISSSFKMKVATLINVLLQLLSGYRAMCVNLVKLDELINPVIMII